MVYYGPRQHVIQMHPPTCPKCGSHRTEIVGLSNESQIIVRCNSCGERSHISREVSARVFDRAQFPAN